VRITDHESSDIHPAWSPDGRTLAFVSERGGGSGIWLVGVDGGRRSSEPVPLGEVQTGAYSPTWSPDGTEIAFVGMFEGMLDVGIVRVDGSSPAKRLTDGADVVRVRWDHSVGGMIASGSWGTERYELRRISPSGGQPEPFDPEIVMGTGQESALFSISFDGNILVYSRENIKGNIWILEGKEGDF
jgi:Tol biopolymer transport system component